MRTMMLVLLLVGVHLFAGAQKTIQKVIYTCIMHPEVQKSRPGSCPKCGMDLVKKTIRVAAPKPAAPKRPAPAKKEAPAPAGERPGRADTAAVHPPHQHQPGEEVAAEREKPKVFLQKGKTV